MDLEMDVRPGSGAMFDRIAARYDLLNRVISLGLDRGWRRALIEETRRDAPPGALLDLATGTGDVAILAAASGLEVVGLDPSAEMLREARRKAPGLRFELGSAEALPFVDGSFAMATMAFGIRNVADRPRALAELARVLVPGGRLGILELGEPEGRLARAHVHGVVPRLGAWLSGRAEYAYLARSIAAFPPPEVFVETIRAAGFVDVRARPLGLGAVQLFSARRA